MSRENKMKKLILAGTVTTMMVFTGVQGAMAGPGNMKSSSPQQPCNMQAKQLDPATQEARDTFLNETTALRKKMAEKTAAMRALMKNTNPDPEKAAQLAGEIFDLREQLRTKAKAAGLPAHMMMGKMGDGPMMGGKHHGNMTK